MKRKRKEKKRKLAYRGTLPCVCGMYVCTCVVRVNVSVRVCFFFIRRDWPVTAHFVMRYKLQYLVIKRLGGMRSPGARGGGCVQYRHPSHLKVCVFLSNHFLFFVYERHHHLHGTV